MHLHCFLGLVFDNHQCRDESIFTPCGRGPRGFALGIPAGGCLCHLGFLEYSTTCTSVPRAPQVPLFPCGVFAFCFVPGAPQGPFGTFGSE